MEVRLGYIYCQIVNLLIYQKDTVYKLLIVNYIFCTATLHFLINNIVNFI